MKRIRVFFVILVAAFVALACEPQKDPVKVDGKFEIEVFDLHSSHCKVKVTPENMDEYYFLGVATEEYLSGFGSLDNMEETAANFIASLIPLARVSKAPLKMYGNPNTLLIWLG